MGGAGGLARTGSQCVRKCSERRTGLLCGAISELQSQIVVGCGAKLGSYDGTLGALRVFQAGEEQGQILSLCAPPQEYLEPGGCLHTFPSPSPSSAGCISLFISLPIPKSPA